MRWLSEAGTTGASLKGDLGHPSVHDMLLQNCSFASQHLPLNDKTPENWGHALFGFVSLKHSISPGKKHCLNDLMKLNGMILVLIWIFANLSTIMKGFIMHFLEVWDTPKRLMYVYIVILNHEYFFWKYQVTTS